MKYILLFTIILSISISAKVQIKSSDTDIIFSINPISLLDNTHKEKGLQLFTEPNYPKVKYLSYKFVAPQKVDPSKIDVRVSLGKRISKKISLESENDKNGNATPLNKNFQKSFYEVTYVKQIAGLHIYKINIYPFSYNVLSKDLAYNENLSVRINFSKKLSAMYKNINLPQKNYLKPIIVNLPKINFKNSTKAASITLSKSLATDFELTTADFIAEDIVIDYLIVTDELFVTQAKKLCTHRLNSSSDNVDFPKYVTTKTVYALYEDFHKDSYQPKAKSIQSAILRLKETSDSLLTFVTLIGSGYTETWNQVRENYIPVFSTELPFDPSNVISYTTSDDLLTVGDDEIPYPKTTFIGRLPARDSEDATNLVDKIIKAEDFASQKGRWKNNVLLLADDDMQGTKVDPIPPHENFLENYVTEFIPNYVNKQRVYMNLYPLDGDYKPTATRDMTSAINAGTLFAIYSGHGGITVLADEKLFHVDNITSLTNDHYPIFLMLSCDIGAFHGVEESLSEVLVNYENHGSHIVFAATKETYPTPNNKLGGEVVKHVYENQNRSFGDIVNESKDEIYDQDEDAILSYHIFGDPASIIRLPVAIPTTEQTTIYPFEKVSTTTSVFSGNWSYEYRFYDALKNVFYITQAKKIDVEYTENGSQLYANNSSVSSGIVSENFIAPKNIKTDDSTAGYNLYLANDSLEYIYHNFGFRSAPPQNYAGNQINNTDGPSVKFFQVNSVNIGALSKETVSPIHNSDEIKLPAVIKIQIADKDGVYLNGNYTLDAGYGGIPYSWDNKKSDFAYEAYNKETGSFSIQLDSNSLTAGLHKLTVSAVDVQGNIAKHDLSVNIVTPDSKRLISRIYTYPNPGKLPIKIVYQLIDKVYEGKVLIYDTRGKLLKDFRIMEETSRIGFNHITWDGKINNGLKLGKGMYIAHIYAYKNAEDKANDVKETKRFKFFIE